MEANQKVQEINITLNEYMPEFKSEYKSKYKSWSSINMNITIWYYISNRGLQTMVSKPSNLGI